MRLLLDTQIVLWWLAGSSRLRAPIRDNIESSACHVSVASIWEVAIKHRLGKLPVAPGQVRDGMVGAGATVLAITDRHAIASGALPDGHADPFDRMLLATAVEELLALVTADAALLAWGQGHGLERLLLEA